MNFDELEQLREVRTEPTHIYVDNVPGADRTLLYGYTCDRRSFHIFKLSGELHRVIYDHNETVYEHTWGDRLVARDCIPDKRVYPESTDFIFAKLLKRREVNPTFLPFSAARFESVRDKQFHGFLDGA